MPATTPPKGRPTPKRDEVRKVKKQKRLQDIAPLLAKWPFLRPGR